MAKEGYQNKSQDHVGLSIIMLILLIAAAFYLRRRGNIEIPFGSMDISGRSYTEAEAELEEAGFRNIILTTKGVSSQELVGKVAEIRVGDQEVFQKGKLFRPDEEIEMTYYVLEQIEITMEAEARGEPWKPKITIRTNLPDKTILRIKMEGEDGNYSEDGSIKVKKGRATSWAFTHDQLKPLPEGDYALTVTAHLKDIPFFARLNYGAYGECFAGEFVRKGEDGIAYICMEAKLHIDGEGKAVIE